MIETLLTIAIFTTLMAWWLPCYTDNPIPHENVVSGIQYPVERRVEYPSSDDD